MRRVYTFVFAIFICLTVFAVFRYEKQVLVIMPTKYEEALVKQFPYTCSFYRFNWGKRHLDVSTAVEEICSLAQKERVSAIVSSNDHAGAILASIASEKLGLIGPDPVSLLRCQHKYFSRLAQKESVPEATPDFSLGPNLSFPCFIKPLRSSFSRYAQQVSSASEITMPEDDFFDFFDQLIATFGQFEASDERILAEELLQGVQVTWEGYIFNGEIETIGIVDSHMYPGTICFERFEYPSQLSATVQKRMEQIAKKFVSHVGLDNTLCNIEFMYDSNQDRISIIECNPRMVLQFADLYEKVDGRNSYELALAIATGAKPTIKKGEGRHRVAASFVLRRFEDAIVVEVPSEKEKSQLKKLYPDALLFVDCQAGQKLSQLFQDGKSYRYGLIHLGASDKEELIHRYEKCKNGLTFTFDIF